MDNVASSYPTGGIPYRLASMALDQELLEIKFTDQDEVTALAHYPRTFEILDSSFGWPLLPRQTEELPINADFDLFNTQYISPFPWKHVNGVGELCCFME